MTLSVTDNTNGTGNRTQTIQLSLPMHVGDIDVTTSNQSNSWSATATVTIHDDNHMPVSNVVVIGSWNDSALSCVTNTSGRCSISRQGIPKRTTSAGFIVSNAALPLWTYTPLANHDPDGDSNGTTDHRKKVR